MLEFEVLGDMNKFMSLQKFLVEIKGKNSRNIDGDLRTDNNAANTNAPHISINALRAFFSECTVSAKGGKISSFARDIIKRTSQLKLTASMVLRTT